MISNVIKKFDILATSLNVLHNYFNSLIQLFSELYLIRYFSKTVLSNHDIVNHVNRIVYFSTEFYKKTRVLYKSHKIHRFERVRMINVS